MTSKEWRAKIHGAMSERVVPYDIIIHPDDDIIADLAAAEGRIAELEAAALRADAAGEAREIIESLAIQFSYDGPHGKISTGGLSALESAFAYLGWDDPRPLPDELLCDEPKCHERSTSGWRDGDRYRRTCQKHWHPPAPEVKA